MITQQGILEEGRTLNLFQHLCCNECWFDHGHGIEGLKYVALGITEEAGEVAGKVKKIIRDDNGVITEEKREALIKELGDVMFYIANAAELLDITLDGVAEALFEKIKSRRERGVMRGSGDDR